MWYFIRQCRRPNGWLGRVLAGTMNRSHAGLTSWGLEHVSVGRGDAVLDVGCGGGMTVRRLAAMAELGTVRGVDYSKASVATARRLNRAAIESGRVEIQSATVSQLPFPDGSFDLATAVETHYYWPDFVADLREIRRVLKPGGTLLIVAEVHAGRWSAPLDRLVMMPLGGTVLSPDEHRESFVAAGYESVEVFLEDSKGWICVRGVKPR